MKNIITSSKQHKDYAHKFTFFETYHHKGMGLATEYYENMCYEIFEEQFQTLDAVFEEYDMEKPDHSREEIRKLVSGMIYNISFGNVAENISEKAGQIANMFLSRYEVDMDAIFKDRDIELPPDQYQLSPELHEERFKVIASAISGKFEQVVSSIGELEQKRTWLCTFYDELVKLNSDDMNSGRQEKSDNSAVVVPMRVYNWRLKSGAHRHQEFNDNYLQKWDEYYSMLKSVRQGIVAAVESVKPYILSESDELYSHRVLKMLNETISAGHALDPYFECLRSVYADFEEFDAK